MAELLEHYDGVEQEGRGRMDPGVRVLLDEVTAIVADHLAQQDMPEAAMWYALDGVPESIVFEACDRLGVTVRGGVWRVRRRA